VAKKVRDKEPVLEILIGTGGHHWKINSAFKGISCPRRKG